jgi:hypothetical protein
MTCFRPSSISQSHYTRRGQVSPLPPPRLSTASRTTAPAGSLCTVLLYYYNTTVLLYYYHSTTIVLQYFGTITVLLQYDCNTTVLMYYYHSTTRTEVLLQYYCTTTALLYYYHSLLLQSYMSILTLKEARACVLFVLNHSRREISAALYAGRGRYGCGLDSQA